MLPSRYHGSKECKQAVEMDAEAVGSLRPTALKAILAERGVSLPSGAVEKQELVQLVLDSGGLPNLPAEGGWASTHGNGSVRSSASSHGNCSSRNGGAWHSSCRSTGTRTGRSSSSHEERRERRRRGEAGFLRLAAAASVLGVSVDAPDPTVHEAQKALMLQWHPDKNPGT